MTTHGALVCKISVRPHPNADRLKLGQIGAFQVVVGDNTQDGDTVLFFSSELRLSTQFARANNLIGYVDADTGEHRGGYFSENCAVRAQKFRGERSDGFVIGLDSLDFIGPARPDLGTIFTEWGDTPVCAKKINLKAQSNRAGRPGTRPAHPWFAKHVDTEQFGYYADRVKPDDLVTLTLKMHGTSGRTALLPVIETVRPSLLKRIFGHKATERTTWAVHTGSRNVELDTSPDAVPAEHGDAAWRTSISNRFAVALHRGETVYYEIVGYLPTGAPIMGRHDFTGSKDFKKWGKVAYTYRQPEGTAGIYVYRITRTIADVYGNPVVTELSWPQVRRRCDELGLTTVPTIQQFTASPATAELMIRTVNDFADGPDPLDPTHPREGVVLRIDSADGRTWFLKHKGLTFRVGEGITREDETFVDLEEAS